MLAQLRIALLMIVVMTALTGLVYPLAMTGIAQVLFNDKADGSLVERDGVVVGSELLGQSFTDADTGYTLPGYFRGRPSAAGLAEDGTIISGGSNYGPTNQIADRPRYRRCRDRPGGEWSRRGCGDSGRSRHRLGQRRRSAHQPGLRRVADRAGGP